MNRKRGLAELRLPVGTVLLIIVGVLIYFGLAHRVLDRMRLSDRAALGWIVAMILGSFANVTLIPQPPLVVNIGGAIIPLIISGYLIATADRQDERVRAIVGSIVTGGAIYALSKVLNPEEQTMFVDPTFVYAIVAGLVAYLAGRSRRASFIGGTAGIILADIALWIEIITRGGTGRVWLGGAGVFDATVIAGLLAVLIAEVVGETREKLQGGSEAVKRAKHEEAGRPETGGDRNA